MSTGYLKISAASEVRDLLAKGYKTDFSVGRWYLCKKDERWYVNAEIRKKFPDIFIDESAKETIFVEPEPTKDPQIPTIPLPTEEFVIRDTAYRALEQVAALEGLHRIEDAEKHELQFAQAKGDNTFSSRSSKENILSIMDVVIYFLIQINDEYQEIEDKLAVLRLERTAAISANERIKEMCVIYEQEIMKRIESEIIPMQMQKQMIAVR